MSDERTTELSNRLHKIESKLTKIIITCFILAPVIAAFLGFQTLVEIPKKVTEAFDNAIGEGKRKVIDKAYQRAEHLLAELPVLPVGTILPMHRLSKDSKLPSGWLLCDGSKVNDKESDFYGQYLPDLNGKKSFIRGSNKSGQFLPAEYPELRIQSVEVKDTGYTHGPVSLTKDQGVSIFAGHWRAGSSNTLAFNYDKFYLAPESYSVVWIIKVSHNNSEN